MGNRAIWQSGNPEKQDVLWLPDRLVAELPLKE